MLVKITINALFHEDISEKHFKEVTLATMLATDINKAMSVFTNAHHLLNVYDPCNRF